MLGPSGDLSGRLRDATCQLGNLATKLNLAGSKIEVHKIETDKQKIVPADFSKPSKVVDNDIVKMILTLVNYLKKLTVTQKFKKMKIRFLIIIHTLLFLNLIN